MPAKNYIVVSLSINPAILDALDAQAEKLGLARSTYIAELVKLVETGKVNLTNDPINGIKVS